MEVRPYYYEDDFIGYCPNYSHYCSTEERLASAKHDIEEHCQALERLHREVWHNQHLEAIENNKWYHKLLPTGAFTQRFVSLRRQIAKVEGDVERARLLHAYLLGRLHAERGDMDPQPPPSLSVYV